MPRATANGIEIEYRTYGETSARPLLLLRGLGTQLIQWEPEFCQRLADAGHYLVIFDNRDVGLSTHFESAGVPKLAELMQAVQSGADPGAPYGIEDMADDTIGLMDALELKDAHVAGISMGGMIAQVTAFRHPARVRSLISIMSSTGNPDLPPAKPEAMAVLVTPPPPEREAYIEHSVKVQRTIGSPGFEFDEAGVREMAGRVYDRAFDPGGVARQMAAVVASGNRKAALASIRAPTLVIHGTDDPLIPLPGGHDTAEAIPGAGILEIPGMGHDVPRGAWDALVDAIADHTGKADRSS
jgi:pimeloyl-ACP methyl ester carboxylesterase